jgi:hypothetical protein
MNNKLISLELNFQDDGPEAKQENFTVSLYHQLQQVLRSPLYQLGLSCPSCHDLLTATQQQRNRERVRQRQQVKANK